MIDDDVRSGAGNTGPEPGLTPGAMTALAGFATGGIVGLLASLDHDDEMSFDDSVEDPEALRRAEEAVARDEPQLQGPQVPIDEDWVVVARQTGVVVVGLDEVARSLEAGGVPIGWDPYDPRDSVAFLPPGIGTGPKSYALVVPESRRSSARRILDSVAPEGVTYAWADSAEPWPAEQEKAFTATPESWAPTAVTSYDRGLSDNERLERLAGSSSPGIAAALVVVLGIVAIVVVLLLMYRG